MTVAARAGRAGRRWRWTPWRAHCAGLAIVAVALLLLFARDAGAMATIWWGSSTYGHCLLIGPIIAWLVWQRAPELRGVAPRAWAPGLAVVALGAGGWMLGQAAGVALARHAGLILMLQGAVIACLGPAVTRGLLFPIAYTIFLIPFGEALEPPLQTITAQMCMALLGVTGVPAQIEGVFITIPNGYFEVAEACSGVKFLIAMFAYGVLVANVCFRSWARRLLFVAAALIAPVLANGLRAWGTIYVAHLTSADAAAGFDHVVYGWIFFGLVIAAVMAAGSPFFDRPVDAPWIAVPAGKDRVGSLAALAVTGLAVLIVAAAPVAWTRIVASSVPSVRLVALPDIAGWARTNVGPKVAWRPRFDGADRLIIGRYRDARGRVVDLAIAVFARQEEGREIVGYGQGAVDPDSSWAWSADTAPPAGGRAARIAAPGPVLREVVRFYRVGDRLTGNDVAVKLETLRARLLGGPQSAVAILVSAEEPGARPAIDAFLAALGPVDRLADRAAGR